jgi:hypothetical protein
MAWHGRGRQRKERRYSDGDEIGSGRVVVVDVRNIKVDAPHPCLMHGWLVVAVA